MSDILTVSDVLEQTKITERQLTSWVDRDIIPAVMNKRGVIISFDNDVIPRIKRLVHTQVAFDSLLSTKTLKQVYDSYPEPKMRISGDVWIVWT